MDRKKIQKDILVVKSKMKQNEDTIIYLRKINIELFSEFLELTDKLKDLDMDK